jgi:hypothetical protein
MAGQLRTVLVNAPNYLLGGYQSADIDTCAFSKF